MRRRLVIVIDANEDMCGECSYQDDETCTLFSCDLDASDDNVEEKERCAECLEAETKALDDDDDD